MIKNFLRFINEEVELKKEYQFQHLNNKQKTEYLIQRIEEFNKNSTKYLKIYEIEYLSPKLKIEYYNLCIQKDYIFSEEEMIESPSKEILIPYLIKRLESFKELGPNLKDFEWDYCTKDLKNEYVNTWIDKGMGLTEHMLSELPNNIVKKYNFNNSLYLRIKTRSFLSNDDFKKCTEELKKFHLALTANSLGGLDKEQLDLCSKELLTYYFNKKIEKSMFFNSQEFNYCPDELKEKYIKIGYTISDEEFNWCSDELKIENIIIIIDKYKCLNTISFNRLSNKLKRLAIEYLIKKNKADLNNDQIQWCKKRRKLYIEYLVKKIGLIEYDEFLKLSDKEKLFYIKLCKINQIYLSYEIKKWFEEWIK
jgi:hypothetical protein